MTLTLKDPVTIFLIIPSTELIKVLLVVLKMIEFHLLHWEVLLFLSHA